MWLTVLEVHGEYQVAEGQTRKEVERLAGVWLEQLLRIYPNYQFRPRFYRVIDESDTRCRTRYDDGPEDLGLAP